MIRKISETIIAFAVTGRWIILMFCLLFPINSYASSPAVSILKDQSLDFMTDQVAQSLSNRAAAMANAYSKNAASAFGKANAIPNAEARKIIQSWATKRSNYYAQLAYKTSARVSTATKLGIQLGAVPLLEQAWVSYQMEYDIKDLKASAPQFNTLFPDEFWQAYITEVAINTIESGLDMAMEAAVDYVLKKSLGVSLKAFGLPIAVVLGVVGNPDIAGGSALEQFMPFDKDLLISWAKEMQGILSEFESQCNGDAACIEQRGLTGAPGLIWPGYWSYCKFKYEYLNGINSSAAYRYSWVTKYRINNYELVELITPSPATYFKIFNSGFSSTTDKVTVKIPFTREYSPLFNKLYPNSSHTFIPFDAIVTPSIGSDGSISVNIFNNILKWDNFLAPVLIGVYKSNGTKVSERSFPFIDVPSTQGAGGSIHKLWRLGIVSGKGDGSFGVASNVTRAEFLTMLLRAKPGFQLVNLSEVSSSSFYDVNVFDWYAPYIEYAKLQGYVSGGACSLLPALRCFRPNDPITRYEASIMATKAYELTYYDTRNKPKWTDYNTDVHSYAPWIAYTHKVMSGYDTSHLGPNDNLKRDQAAIIVNRLMSASKP